MTQNLNTKNKSSKTPFFASLLSFIDRHDGVFESLSRQATPFGGNWLPENRRALNAQATQEQLTTLQQQVDGLTKEITRLRAQNNALAAQSENRKTEIGINRFRALRANS
ncbi:hypothetical protein ACFQ4C_17275 [Larkinella insperata]|uniref:Uncharacterized protein n=1 Tax=Larkinella insperata TaxID=332158 RepID=A0ABW3QEC1_9BACT|nr:hypothetical protein [Larkinella insperata]